MTRAITISAFLAALVAAVFVNAQIRAPAAGTVGPTVIVPIPAGVMASPITAFDSGRLGTSGARGGQEQRPVLTGKTVFNFKKDFLSRINPRGNTDWQFIEVEDYVADGATFLIDQPESIDMVSLPYHVAERHPTASAGRLAGLTGIESLLTFKQNFTVPDDQMLTVRLVFSCKTFNVDQSPFPKDIVSKFIDDPTLASCGLAFAGDAASNFNFYVVATDKGIWAVYERSRFNLVEQPLSSDRRFTIFHHLAERRTPYEPIDAGVQYDKVTGRVSFLLNNKIEWFIENIGMLPVGDQWLSQYTLSRPDIQQVVVPKYWQVGVGLFSWLDVSDPLNPASMAKVRLVKDPQYYDEKIKFWDNEGKTENKLWGQGASMTLYDLAIDTAVSTGSRAPRGWDDKHKCKHNKHCTHKS